MRFVRFAAVLALVAGLFVTSTSAVNASDASASQAAALGPWNKTVTGRTVDAETGRPVAFAFVRAYNADFASPQGRATFTWVNGQFRLRGLYEEFALRVDGRWTNHEVGWLACSGEVVQTTGEACTFGPGDVGRVRLDRR